MNKTRIAGLHKVFFSWWLHGAIFRIFSHSDGEMSHGNLEVSYNGSPIAGWFISSKFPNKNGMI